MASRALVSGHTAGSLGIARTREYELVAVEREGEMLGPEAILEAGDGLVFMATETGVRALWGSPFFGTSPDRLYAVTIRSGSGTEVRELEDGALRVVAARSASSLRDTRLPPGDMCFVSAREVGAVRAHAAVGLWQDAASRVPQPRRTWVAVLILAGVIVAASVGAVPIELAAVAGAVLMVLTGVLRPGQAARAVDLNIIGILAGSIGLGVIVVTSGLADVLADVVRTLSSGEVVLVVVVFALATALMTNVVTNAAAVSILTPVGSDHRIRDGDRPGRPPGAHRDVRLVHVHQPVRAPDQPDGDAPRRLHDRDLRSVRPATHHRGGHHRDRRCERAPAPLTRRGAGPGSSVMRRAGVPLPHAPGGRSEQRHVDRARSCAS